MTAQPTGSAGNGPAPEHPLVTQVEDAHVHALEALDEGRALDAVVWLSAHLAACQRTIHQAAGRRVTSAVALQALRRADRTLETLVRRLEQRASGDALAAQLDEERLDRALRDALAAHSRAEHSLLGALVASSEPAQLDRIAASYASALEHAPTRPHPHVPHRGLLGAAAFVIDAWRDRVMDTMDNRHVPSPRVQKDTVTPGRWGLYVLGEMKH